MISVGEAATDALYFNACGWANPSGATPDSTPFYIAGGPLNSLPGADAYEEAAPATASQNPVAGRRPGLLRGSRDASGGCDRSTDGSGPAVHLRGLTVVSRGH